MRRLKGPQVGRVERIRLLDARGGERLADRLEVLRAVLLDERLEEGHAEHFAFAFVDARGEVLVDVVAEHVAVQERAAAVRLHEAVRSPLPSALRCRRSWRRCIPFRRDSPASIRPGAPGDEGVAGDDQPGQSAEAALHQFAGGDRCAVGLAELGPGDHAGQHHRIVPAALAQRATRPRFRP